MRFESTPQASVTPSVGEGHEAHLVGNYAAPSLHEREEHAKEVAKLEAAMRDLETEIREMPPLGRLKAVIAGHPESAQLEKLRTELKHLRGNPRFAEEAYVKH
jgi:hypothetical protein